MQAKLAAMTDEVRHKWVKDIVKRLMKAWGLKEQQALAKYLGLHDNTVNNWVQNRTLPWKAILTCHQETGHSLDWLWDGNSEPNAAISQQQTKAFKAGARKVLESCESIEMIKQLDKNGFEWVLKGLMTELNKAFVTIE